MNLKNNSFYILGVSCSDNRRAIMAAAEEKSFELEQDVCTEAQNTLINPAKRLAAELDWFIDVDNSAIATLRIRIENGEVISTDGLSSLSKLNATLFNFSISDDGDIYDVGYSILDIDDMYSAIDVSEVVSVLNANRSAAKMPEVQAQVVLQEMNKKRESIRQVIMDKLSIFSREDYIELITLLAEKCVDIDDETGVVISDVIDQYEVSIQAELEKSTDDVEQHIERIKSLSSESAIHENISGLIRRVQAWDKLAQPLQLKSQASGMPHEISEHLGRELRELALFLHNEKGLSEDALTLVDAMQDVFAELGGLADLFESDSNALNDLIKGNAEAEAVLKEMQSLQSAAADIKTYATETKIDSFISRVNALDRRIKGLSLDFELQTQVRENLCYMARDVAITLHNNKNQTEYASKIANALKTEFSDVASLRAKLTEDCSSLNQQLMYKQVARQRQAQQEAQQKSKNIGCLVVIGIFVLIMIIASFGGGSSKSSSSSSSGSSSYSSSSSSSSSSSGKNSSSSSSGSSSSTSTETKYSSSTAKSGDKVYVDIVSIFPEIGIYTQGSSSYSHFVCKCKTSSGSTVWVYMTCSEYKSNFDSSASTSVYSSYADEVTFSSSKRIHGTVKTANNIMSGLSSDTGTYVIDFSSLGK